MEEFKATIAVDFDGTITSFSKFPKTGCVRPWIPDFLYALREKRYRLVLNTCRANQYFTEAQNVLKRKNLYDLFDWEYIKDKSNYGQYGKIKAAFYVDDSACFESFDCVNPDKLIKLIDQRVREKKERNEAV